MLHLRNKPLYKALTELGFIGSLTKIQKLAIPQLVNGQSGIISAETGSGKTLAYLLPLVDQLSLPNNDSKPNEENVKTTTNATTTNTCNPRGVILCPTRELISQIRACAVFLSHHVKFRTIALDSHFKDDEKLGKGNHFDLLISTPSTLLNKWKAGLVKLDSIRTLVLDEADVLLSPTFASDVNTIVEEVDSKHNLPQLTKQKQLQLIAVGATVLKTNSNGLVKWMNQKRPHALKLYQDEKITLPKKLNLEFELVKPNEGINKHFALKRVLSELVVKKKVKKIVIFCNSIQSCDSTCHAVNEWEDVATTHELLRVYRIHGKVLPQTRKKDWEEFNSMVGDEGEMKNCSKILICTDSCSRGLDINVDHVIMFDIAKDMIDTIHRVGRTARAGKEGVATFIVSRREIAMVGKIEKQLLKEQGKLA